MRVFVREERFDQDPRVDQAQAASGAKADYTVRSWVDNQSSLPVYEVILGWRLGARPYGVSAITRALMPHVKLYAYRELPDDFPPSGDKSLLTAVAFFRDAAGTYSRARPDGSLDEIAADQLPPHSW